MEQNFKPILSSDCSLEFDYMKSELLVMVGQLYHREYVPVPCTHRPSNHGSRGSLKTHNVRLRGKRWLGLSRNKVSLPEGGDRPLF